MDFEDEYYEIVIPSLRRENSSVYQYILDTLFSVLDDEESIMEMVSEESMSTYQDEHYKKNTKRNLSTTSWNMLKYRKEHGKNEKCFVCMEDFKTEEELFELTKCNHLFHEDCLKEMVKFNPICALCKKPIDTFEDIELQVSDK